MRRLLLLLPLASACELTTGPRFPANAQRFSPPAIYRQWWAITEACSGRRGSFDAVAWYVVPDARSVPGLSRSTLGAWFPDGNRIVLVGKAQPWGDLVRHEMLHALLDGGGHPRSQFLGGCEGVVACDEQCAADGGPPAPFPPGALHVAPTTLDVSVSVEPASPSSAILDGYFMMTIMVRNPMLAPVLVELPLAGDAGPSVSYGYNLIGTSSAQWYSVRAWAPEVTRFAPREVKRFIFDFRIGNGEFRYDLPPGTYVFKGSYGYVWAANPPTVTVGH